MFLPQSPIYGPIKIPLFELTDKEKLRLKWLFDGGGHLVSKPCVYFNNVDRGLECTAQNCPCELYEVE
jgi:hypothetical protein